jgi:hypothetical protein
VHLVNFLNMPVAAPDNGGHIASRKAASDYCKSLGNTFAVEANTTTQNIATLITMLLSIASDCGPAILPVLIMFLSLTDRVPLASMALSIRFSIVDLQASKVNPSPRARVMNQYSDPAFI